MKSESANAAVPADDPLAPLIAASARLQATAASQAQLLDAERREAARGEQWLAQLLECQPVATLIVERLGVTLELTLTALVFASVGGMVLGVAAARMRGRWPDTAIQTASSAGYSIPDFWLGQLLILTFAIGLGWLPSQGNSSVRDATEGFAGWLDHMRYLILPAFALSLRYLALITRITGEQLDVYKAQVGDNFFETGKYREAADLFRTLVLADRLEPFLTLPAYEFYFAK